MCQGSVTEPYAWFVEAGSIASKENPLYKRRSPTRNYEHEPISTFMGFLQLLSSSLHSFEIVLPVVPQFGQTPWESHRKQPGWRGCALAETTLVQTRAPAGPRVSCRRKGLDELAECAFFVSSVFGLTSSASGLLFSSHWVAKISSLFFVQLFCCLGLASLVRSPSCDCVGERLVLAMRLLSYHFQKHPQEKATSAITTVPCEGMDRHGSTQATLDITMVDSG
jgi:hypothetical protein